MKRLWVTGALLFAGCEDALSPAVPVAAITITPDTATITSGATLQLGATLIDSAGQLLTGRTVAWSSSDTFMATITGTGLVTGRRQGRVTITARAEGKAGTARITVFAPVARVTVDQDDQTIVVGGTLALSATPRDREGAPLAGRLMSWSSADPATAAVSAGGLVTALAPGSVTITATSEGQSGTATVRIAVITLVSLSASPSTHTCGLTGSGAVFCWGNDELGQLGNGPGGASATPIGVSSRLTFESVNGGGTFTCGLATGGAAFCWGSGARGRLGNGSLANSTVPVAVSGGLSFTSLGLGWSHACGITGDGDGFCWGAGGALGADAGKASLTPVPVLGELILQAISAGDGFTCGLTTRRIAYCWGNNSEGQLGTAGTASSVAPVPVSGRLAFESLESGPRHTCGLTADGAAYCWGSNAHGQLGNSSTAPSNTPLPVGGGLRFATISAGDSFTCGVTIDGAAYCWGDNGDGQLGSSLTTESCDGRGCSTVPLAVSGKLDFAMVTAGDAHACGLTRSGVAYCWGSNARGQLGDGSSTNSATPVRIAGQP